MNHPPHPETCLRRLVEAAQALHELRRLGAESLSERELEKIVTEAAHLGAYDEAGLMAPVLDLIRYVYWTPAEANRLQAAIARWEAGQQGAAK